jgi:tRNA splicing endonuclease
MLLFSSSRLITTSTHTLDDALSGCKSPSSRFFGSSPTSLRYTSPNSQISDSLEEASQDEQRVLTPPEALFLFQRVKLPIDVVAVTRSNGATARNRLTTTSEVLFELNHHNFWNGPPSLEVIFSAYCAFRDASWIVKPGAHFATDLSLYRNDPSTTHAEALVIVTCDSTPCYWLNVNRSLRVAQHHKKSLVICTVTEGETDDLPWPVSCVEISRCHHQQQQQQQQQASLSSAT